MHSYLDTWMSTTGPTHTHYQQRGYHSPHCDIIHTGCDVTIPVFTLHMVPIPWLLLTKRQQQFDKTPDKALTKPKLRLGSPVSDIVFCYTCQFYIICNEKLTGPLTQDEEKM